MLLLSKSTFYCVVFTTDHPVGLPLCMHYSSSSFLASVPLFCDALPVICCLPLCVCVCDFRGFGAVPATSGSYVGKRDTRGCQPVPPKAALVRAFVQHTTYTSVNRVALPSLSGVELTFSCCPWQQPPPCYMLHISGHPGNGNVRSLEENSPRAVLVLKYRTSILLK